ncbi:MAG: hypothetical protein K5831_12905 [Brevundimonas sp.]|nr:hypothetical protein [Brevundimonas sp.]
MSYSLFKRLDQGISRHILDVPVTERMTSPPWHTRMKAERDILKKAAAYFAKDSI